MAEVPAAVVCLRLAPQTCSADLPPSDGENATVDVAPTALIQKVDQTAICVAVDGGDGGSMSEAATFCRELGSAVSNGVSYWRVRGHCAEA
jgi:hypothetical protein